MPPSPDLSSPESKGKAFNYASHCPHPAHMVPGKEVKDLLLAAGDSSKGFHDGTGCLPCCLCCWGKEYLPDTGEEMGLGQRTPCFSRPIARADSHPSRTLEICLGKGKGPQHQLTHCPWL